MKLIFLRALASIIPFLAFPLAADDLPAQTAGAALTPASVLNEMQRVADYQLAHPVAERPTG
jgi:hypothetical protein